MQVRGFIPLILSFVALTLLGQKPSQCPLGIFTLGTNKSVNWMQHCVSQSPFVLKRTKVFDPVAFFPLSFPVTTINSFLKFSLFLIFREQVYSLVQQQQQLTLNCCVPAITLSTFISILSLNLYNSLDPHEVKIIVSVLHLNLRFRGVKSFAYSKISNKMAQLKFIPRLCNSRTQSIAILVLTSNFTDCILLAFLVNVSKVELLVFILFLNLNQTL